MNRISPQTKDKIRILRDTCRFYIFVGKLKEANACLTLAKRMYKKDQKDKTITVKVKVA